MTIAVNALQGTPHLARSTLTAIPQLSPSLGPTSLRSIDAVVTLLWPYSSSNKTFFLLLADPDFRLRRSKGQVKVAFQGPSAKAVAATRVGIGDHVNLCLDGASWTHLAEDVHTPGKSVDWDISFGGRVELKVFRNNIALASVNIDESTPPASPSIPEVSNNGTNGHHAASVLPLENGAFSAVAAGSLRLHPHTSSGSLYDTAFHPFVEEDGSVLGQGRKRTKFARESGSWRYLDRSPSPVKRVSIGFSSPSSVEQQEDSQDGQTDKDTAESPIDGSDRPSATGSQSGHTFPQPETIDTPADESGRLRHPTFVVPPLPLPRDARTRTPPASILTTDDSIKRPTTPRLMPLSSPGLPLVSPLVKGTDAYPSYFSSHEKARSELDTDSRLENGSGVREPRDSEDLRSISKSVDLPLALPIEDQLVLEEEEQSASEIQHIPSDGRQHASSSPPVTTPEGRQFSATPSPMHQGSLLGEDIGQDGTTGIATEQQESGDEVEVISLQESSLDDEIIDVTDSRDDAIATAEFEALSAEEVKLGEEDLDMYGVSDQEEEVKLPSIPDRPTLEVLMEAVEHQALFGPVSTVPISQPAFTRPFSEHEVQQVPRSWSQDYSNKTIVSATECIHERVSITAPPFPFRQFWDHDARAEVKTLKRANELQSSRRASYDGSVDEIDSDSSLHSETERHLESPSLITGAVTPNQGNADDSELERLRSQPLSEDLQEYFVTPGNSSVGLQVDSLEVVNDEVVQPAPPAATNEASVYDGKDGSTTISPLEDEGALDQAVSVNLELPAKARVDGEHEVEMPASADPLDHIDHDTLNTMRTRSDSLPEIDIGEAKGSAAEIIESVETPNSKDSVSDGADPLESRLSKQLMTPNNTQEMDILEGTKLSGTIEEARLPTPQPTQSFQELPQFQTTLSNLDGNIDPSADNQTERRRSPRITRKSALSATKADFVSPWFTPRQSNNFVSADDPPEKEVTLEEEEKPTDTVKLATTFPELETNTEPELVAVSQEVDSSALAPTKEEGPSSLRLRYIDWPKGLRTSLSYFPALSGLSSHFNQTVDIIGLCSSPSTAVKRAPSGPKDYFTTLHICDPTSRALSKDTTSPSSVIPTTVQIFRPWRNALPLTKDGDVVLLRHFKVQSRKREMMLLTTKESGWAVFPIGAEEEKISGPPVEYGHEEKMYADKLQAWWQETRVSLTDKAEGKSYHTRSKSNGVSIKPLHATTSHKRHLSKASQTSNESRFVAEDPPPFHELRDGASYSNDVNVPINPLDVNSSHQRRPSKASQASSDFHPPAEDPHPLFHELRDGVSYSDDVNVPTPLLHELRDGTRYTDPDPNRVTPRPLSSRGPGKSGEKGSSVHELRDGSTYMD